MNTLTDCCDVELSPPPPPPLLPFVSEARAVGQHDFIRCTQSYVTADVEL